MNIFGKIGMVFLIVLNVIFILLGLGLIIIGALIYGESSLIDENVIPLLNEIDIGNFNLGTLLEAVATIVIILGVFVFAVSATGAFGACCKNRVLLVLYGIIVLLMAVLEIFVIVVCCQILYGLNSSVKRELLSLLSSYEGDTSNSLTNAWNIIFILFECCGVNAQSSVDNFASTTWSASRGSEIIPGHCCRDATKDTASTFYGTTCTTSPSTSTSFFDQGCYTALENALQSFSGALVAVCSVIVFVEVLAIVAVVAMVIEITRDGRSNKVV